jgi:hypothetical protein
MFVTYEGLREFFEQNNAALLKSMRQMFDEQTEKFTTAIGAMEERIRGDINVLMEGIDVRFQAVDTRFASIEQRLRRRRRNPRNGR